MWDEQNSRGGQIMWADNKQILIVTWAELNHTAVNRRRRTAVGRKKLSQVQTYVMGWMWDKQKIRRVMKCAELNHTAVKMRTSVRRKKLSKMQTCVVGQMWDGQKGIWRQMM